MKLFYVFICLKKLPNVIKNDKQKTNLTEAPPRHAICVDWFISELIDEFS